MAGSVASIEIGFEFGSPLPLVFDRIERLPFVTAVGGHCVRQPKRNHLNKTGLVAMRQITTRMPARKRLWRHLTIALVHLAPAARGFVRPIRFAQRHWHRQLMFTLIKSA